MNGGEGYSGPPAALRSLNSALKESDSPTPASPVAAQRLGAERN